MKRRLLAITLGWVLMCGIQIAFAQPERDVLNVFVGNTPETEQHEQFLSQFEVTMEAQHIEMDFVESSFREVQLEIRFSRSYGRSDVILSARAMGSLDLSPILNFDTGAYVTLDNRSQSLVEEIALGISFYVIGKCQNADSYLEAAQNQLDAKDDILFFQLEIFRGNCAIRDGDLDKALSHLAHSVHSDITLTENSTIGNLGWVYLQLNEEASAFSLANELVDAWMTYGGDLEQIDALSLRAQLYALAFRYDEAIADMDTAIEIYANSPYLYVLRGQITLYLYEWDRVLADYNRAIELDPDYADAYYYRGVLFYTQAQREDALADFEHYLDLAPDGDHAADAGQYIADIQRELAALG